MFSPRLTLAAIPLMLLSACGSDGSTEGTTVPADLVVVARSISWTQTEYEATSTGGKLVVTLDNKDAVDHNLHLIAADGKDTGTVVVASPGRSETATYPVRAGTYTIFCSIPGHGNMRSTLTVKER